MLHQQISLQLGSAVDAEARIYFHACGFAELTEITGQLNGPHCDFARTLPATYDVRPLPGEQDAPCLAEAAVPDPCYWTPQLPFHYTLQLNVKTGAGEVCDYESSISVKRWFIDGAHWKLERRRIVLRGAAAVESEEILAAARDAETTLFVPSPSDAFYAAASRLGVPLVVDLRDFGDRLPDELARLDWNPAVMAALLISAQQSAIRDRPRNFFLGQAIGPDTRMEECGSNGFDFIAVELAATDRPPAWLASFDKPVIAIRRGEKYADLSAARAACNRFQAELAPEFDLAGYFVS